MSAFIDLTGQRFGLLTAINRMGRDNNNSVVWLCKCDCGKEVTVRSYSLRSGNTKSCGCLMLSSSSRLGKKSKIHGESHARLYAVWRGMKRRCYCPRHKYFKDYGGRGIQVCEEWRDNYQAFRDWAYANGYDEMAPKGQCTIDRIDCNSNYTPENCRWVDMKTQRHNRRDSRKDG